MGTMTGKSAIVTGASSGIGRAIAERFARDGASVEVSYAKSANQAKEVVTAIDAGGGKAIAIQADIDRIRYVGRLFRDTLTHFGQVEILVNNAAASFNTLTPVVEVTENEFDAVFALNARRAFSAMQEAARVLPDCCRNINISTVATGVGLRGLSAYLGSKVALEQFTLVLANELGARGITVNTVSTGVTETQMLEGLFALCPPDMKTMLIQRTPMGRLGQPADVADAAAFLASDDARWVTGQNLRADGGIR